jgi:hypothetical protein
LILILKNKVGCQSPPPPCGEGLRVGVKKVIIEPS